MLIILCKVALNFETVDKIVKFDHPNKAARSCAAVGYAVQGCHNV